MSGVFTENDEPDDTKKKNWLASSLLVLAPDCHKNQSVSQSVRQSVSEHPRGPLGNPQSIEVFLIVSQSARSIEVFPIASQSASESSSRPIPPTVTKSPHYHAAFHSNNPPFRFPRIPPHSPYYYASLRLVCGNNHRPNTRGGRWVIPARGVLKCC